MRPRSNPLAYLSFLLEAVNQHGVHSPFIYNFLTRSLYIRDGFKADRSSRVLHKCLSYFDLKEIRIPEEKASLLPKPPKKGRPPYDLVYLDQPSGKHLQNLLPDLHNDSMVLVDGIRNSVSELEEWNAMKAMPEVRVTLDLFSCGLIFFRREQAEEHFKIRR